MVVVYRGWTSKKGLSHDPPLEEHKNLVPYQRTNLRESCNRWRASISQFDKVQLIFRVDVVLNNRAIVDSD